MTLVGPGDLMDASFDDKFRVGQLQARYRRVTGRTLSDEDALVMLQTKHDPLACQVIIPDEAKENIKNIKGHLKILTFSMVLSVVGSFLTDSSGWLYLPGAYLFFGASVCAVGVFFFLSLECFMYMENSARGRRTLYYYPLWTVLAFPICAAIIMMPLEISGHMPKAIVEFVPDLRQANVPFYYLPIAVLSVVLGYINANDNETPIRIHTLIFSAIGMAFCVDGHYWAYPAVVAFVVGECLAVRTKMPP